MGGLAIGFQSLILLAALLIGVLDPQPPQEAKLKLPPGSPSRQREQAAEVQQQLARLNRMEKAARQAMAEQMLQAEQPQLEMPMPDVAAGMKTMGAMLPMEGFFREDSATAMTAGMEVEALPPPDPVEFLGENIAAKRIVLLLDVSGSVKSKMERSGVSMDRLREEILRFIDQLSPNHLFGIIQFTRKWQAFRPELVPATEKVRTEARDWLSSSFRITGTSGRGWTGGQPNGIEAVLAAAFAMDAQLDELVLVGDADFQRTPPGGGGQDVPWPELRALCKRLQEQSIGQARFRVLAFYPGEEDLQELKAWVRENGPGSLKLY